MQFLVEDDDNVFQSLCQKPSKRPPQRSLSQVVCSDSHTSSQHHMDLVCEFTCYTLTLTPTLTLYRSPTSVKTSLKTSVDSAWAPGNSAAEIRRNQK